MRELAGVRAVDARDVLAPLIHEDSRLDFMPTLIWLDAIALWSNLQLARDPVVTGGGIFSMGATRAMPSRVLLGGESLRQSSSRNPTNT